MNFKFLLLLMSLTFLIGCSKYALHPENNRTVEIMNKKNFPRDVLAK